MSPIGPDDELDSDPLHPDPPEEAEAEREGAPYAESPERIEEIIQDVIRETSAGPEAVASGPDVPREPSAEALLAIAESAPDPSDESSPPARVVFEVPEEVVAEAGIESSDPNPAAESASAEARPGAEVDPSRSAAIEAEPQAEAEPSQSTSIEAEQPETGPAARRSAHEGMGAVPYGTGVAFRVWAPHADAVTVAGTFGGEEGAHPLAPEENGMWSVDVEGARAGDHYRFVIRAGGEELERADPYSRDLEHSVGDSIVVDTAFDWGDESAYRMPPWNELVIYELHVGTFNDNPEGAPGTFQGVIDRLDYLRDLGVNAIEVMPAMEFAADFSWGYNPSFIFALESAFGGPAEFKRLVREAHARGIAVIFDVVYNHLGPSDLSLWRFDGWSVDGKGGIYFYNDDRSTTPWGDTRPDYSRDEVRRYLADNARMWLEEFRLDGLRWDATAYIRNVDGNDGNPTGDIGDGWTLMQSLTSETDATQPWKMHIAEDLRANEWITREAEAGGAGFDTQWDGEFVHPVRRAIIAPWDDSRSMHDVRRAIEHRYNGDPVRRVIYTESHDEVANGKARVPHEISPGDPADWFARKRSTLGPALVFTSPGIPMLFQGQEILEDEWFRDTDPVDWSKLTTHAGVHLLYSDLMKLRRNWFDHTRGLRGRHVDVHHVNDADKVIAFHRWENGGARDDVIVIANFANRAYDRYEIGLPRAGEWKVRLNSDWSGYGADYGTHPSNHLHAESVPRDGLPFTGAVGLGPYTTIILSQDD
jgi:1,4-alpha-glucan branching enzyme